MKASQGPQRVVSSNRRKRRNEDHTRCGPSAYTFDLKQRLAEQAYEFAWLRVYDLPGSPPERADPRDVTRRPSVRYIGGK